MMSKLTLQVGNPITLTVSGASEVEGNYGPQAKFDSDEGTLYLTLSTAQRQLDRLGLDLQTVAGETLTFEKVEKAGKTFTNINRAPRSQPSVKPLAKGEYAAGGFDPVTGRDTILDEQEQHETQAVKAIQQGADYAERMVNLSKLYGACLNIAFTQVPAACKTANVPVTAEALVAATATLLIAADKRGIAA